MERQQTVLTDDMSADDDVSVGVDALLLAARDQFGDQFLKNFCSHLTDLQNLLMVHLFLPTVVQRNLQHHKCQPRHTATSQLSNSLCAADFNN